MPEDLFHCGVGRDAVFLAENVHLSVFDELVGPADPLDRSVDAGVVEEFDDGRAEAVLEVPLNAAFHSLNLSQAVLLVAYEWFQAQNPSEPVRLPESRTPAATKEELMNFFNRLETALDTCGFFHVAEKRPIVVRNIRNFFQRAELREQEVKILHGIVTCLFRGSDSGRT